MTEPVVINLRFIARETNLSAETVETVVRLFDEGRPVPFIARYRKDETGNLDAETIRQIETLLQEQRQLAERKETILRSIESLGKLTPTLDKKIREARTSRRLEDLYLPYKPKKQTLASVAKEKGLEPLALEFLEAETAFDPIEKATAFVDAEKGLTTVEDVLTQVGYIVSEALSEKVELRSRVRELFYRSGKIVSTRIVEIAEPEEAVSRPTKEAADQIEANPVETTKSESNAVASDLTNQTEPAVASEPLVAQTSETTDSPSETIAENDSTETASETTAENDSTETASEAFVETESTKAPAEATDESDSTKVPTEAVVESESTKAQAEASVESESTARKQTQQKTENKSKKKKKSAKEQKQEQLVRQFVDYFDFKSEIRLCPPHRILAMNRGEKLKLLRIKLDVDNDQILKTAEEVAISPECSQREFLSKCLADALGRLILPSLEREVRRDLTDRAEEQAVQVFAKNLKNLLLQKPLSRRRVLAIDPGFKNGCKIAALDEFGNFLAYDAIFINGSQERKNRAAQKIRDLIEKYKLSVVAIGNGTGCRETEEFVADLVSKDYAEKDVAYIIVNEAGASVYSVSPTAKEEFPSYDPYVRGAIFIGRRLQDPLNELVKIEPGSLGVGMYQHDVKPKRLKDSLTQVVEAGVNFVGVDLNSATPSILRYVSGLNQLTAKRIYEYRVANGPFRTREQLMNVSGFGEAAFTHSAGFLKIPDGYNPFDATWIHPENYDLATKILEKFGFSPDDLRSSEKRAELAEKIATADAETLAGEFQTGVWTVRDLLEQFVRPGRDPREELPPPIFKKGIMKIEDLSVGMELTGTVLNVVDFGAFVDVGLHESGLIHISQMGDRFVRDAHQCVAVGDVVKVWVIEADATRRRISLSLLPPGTERRLQRNRDERKGNDRDSDAQPERRSEGGERRSSSETTGNRRESSGGERRDAKPRADYKPRSEKESGDRRSNDRKFADRKSDDRDNRRFDRGRGRDFNRPKTPRVVVAAPKEKTIEPISENMKKGKEPMRSFSDLAQLFGRIQPTEEKASNEKKPEKQKPANESPSLDNENRENVETQNRNEASQADERSGGRE